MKFSMLLCQERAHEHTCWRRIWKEQEVVDEYKLGVPAGRYARWLCRNILTGRECKTSAKIWSVSVVERKYIRHRLIWSCWISIERHRLETGRENLISNQLMPAGRQQWYQQLGNFRLQAQRSRQRIHREGPNGHLQRVTSYHQDRGTCRTHHIATDCPELLWFGRARSRDGPAGH